MIVCVRVLVYTYVEKETIPWTFLPETRVRRANKTAQPQSGSRQSQVEAAEALAKIHTTRRKTVENSRQEITDRHALSTNNTALFNHCKQRRRATRARAVPMALGAIPLFPGVLVIARYIEKLFLATRFAGDRSEWSGISPIDIGVIWRLRGVHKSSESSIERERQKPLDREDEDHRETERDR